MDAFQSSRVHSKNHRVCPILLRNIGPICTLFSTKPPPCPTEGLICHEWFKELLYQGNYRVHVTHGTTHDPEGLSCPHKKYWVLRPLSSTRTPSIEPLLKSRSDRTDMPWMIQRATVPEKWLRHNHILYIPRRTGPVLATQEIFGPSVHYPVLTRQLELKPCTTERLICREWFKELFCQDIGSRLNPVRFFQDLQGLSYSHKKYWTHWSIMLY